MRILFIASGDFAIPTLTAIAESDIEIACVFTQPDRSAGRGRQLRPTPVKAEALKLGLSVVEAEDINSAKWVEYARACDATVGVVIAFGQKIKPEFRNVLPGGCVNLHASLLPKYRGAAPFQRAVLDGVDRTGATVFKLVDRMDAGAILGMVETVIGPSETAADLHDRLAVLGAPLSLEVLEQFRSMPYPDGVEQDDSLATPAPKLKKDDGKLRFDMSAREVVSRINGLWSWPGAKCRFLSGDGGRSEEVTLVRAVCVEDCADCSQERDSVGQDGGGGPGVLDAGLRVGTSAGVFEVLEIKPSSGKRMAWSAFVNGRHVRVGDRFESVD